MPDQLYLSTRADATVFVRVSACKGTRALVELHSEEAEMAENARIHACFSGHVQGVGFRFTAIDIADQFPEITGFVRNLRDGRVEVVAEGPEERVSAFVVAVEDAMGPYIRGVDKSQAPATGEFSDFSIAR
jgi:acylphosphatase